MTGPSSQQLASGARNAVIFLLDANGYPAAAGSTAYEGFQVVGLKAYNLTVPASRKLVHEGDDRVLAVDFLPPTDAVTGELQVASQDLVMNAALQNVKEFTVGVASMIPWITDQQGSEPEVGILMFQQSLATATKNRNWRFHILPRVKVIPQPAGMDANVVVGKYEMAPSPSSLHLWGAPMTDVIEGATESALVEGASVNKPKLIAFKGNGITTAFLFPTNKPAKSALSIAVWVNGILKTVTTDYTTPTPGEILFATAPISGAAICVWYEY